MTEVYDPLSWEPELPIRAADILGGHILEMVASMDKIALRQGNEQLVFSSREGYVGALNLATLTGFIEQVMPVLGAEHLIRSWVLTGGRITTAHLSWQSSDQYPDQSTAVAQLCSDPMGSVTQTIDLCLNMRGVLDKETDHLKVVFGEVDEKGTPQDIASIELTESELSGALSPEKSQMVTNLVAETESLLAYAEANTRIQIERQPLPP